MLIKKIILHFFNRALCYANVIRNNQLHTFCKKDLPQQAEVAQVVPVRLMPRIFLTFGTKRVVDRQPYAPAAFTPGEIPGTHF